MLMTVVQYLPLSITSNDEGLVYITMVCEVCYWRIPEFIAVIDFN